MMPVNQEKVSKVLSILSHPLRREILLELDRSGESSFTDLMHAQKVDTGKLSFHIRSLLPLLEQTATGKYKLNKSGVNAIKFIRDLEFWAEEAETVRKTSKLPLATYERRAVAFLIDFVLMLTIIIVSTLNFDLSNVLLGTLVLLWGYSTLLEGFKGQTIGKRILGLRVVRVDEKNLSYDYAAVRNFGKAFVLPIDLLVGLRLNDEIFIRYFDKFAGTTVIDLRG
jgi:uncharacterized RDD family membrane protein YckC